MKKLKIYYREGQLPFTDNVAYSNIINHIESNDRFSTEAAILKMVADDENEDFPIAFKFSDPIEDEKLIYSTSDYHNISLQDDSLLVNLEFSA